MIRSTNGSRISDGRKIVETLANTRNALARAGRGQGPLRISILGDSTIVAFGAVGGAQDITGNAKRSIGKHLLTWIPRLLGVSARRDSFFGSGNISYSDATKAQYDSRFSQSGSLSYDDLHTIGNGAIKFSTAGDTLTFTPDNQFSEVNIRSLGGIAGWGAVQVSIGGVNVGTIAAADGANYKLTTYSGTWENRTPIVFTNLNVGNMIFDLLSLECVDSSFFGAQVLEMGWSGCTIADLVSDTYAWQHLPALVAQDPDLVILKCTTNDSGSPIQGNVATPAGVYSAALEKLKAALPNADIIFADLFPSSYSDINPGALDGFKAAAVALGLPVIDLREIYGDTSTAALATGLAIGPVHPGEVAYSLYARLVTERIYEACRGILLGRKGAEVYNRPEDLPMFGNQDGDEVLVRRISGTNVVSTGYFTMQWSAPANRWQVKIGQSPIADATELIYTSVGTALVPLKSAIIPAGLVGDKELWEVSSQTSLISGSVDAVNSHQLRIGGSYIWASTSATPSVPYSYDVIPRRFRRAGNTIRRYTTSLSDGFSSDEVQGSVNMDNDQAMESTIIPSAIGNSYRARRLLLTRVG